MREKLRFEDILAEHHHIDRDHPRCAVGGWNWTLEHTAGVALDEAGGLRPSRREGEAWITLLPKTCVRLTPASMRKFLVVTFSVCRIITSRVSIPKSSGAGFIR